MFVLLLRAGGYVCMYVKLVVVRKDIIRARCARGAGYLGPCPWFRDAARCASVVDAHRAAPQRCNEALELSWRLLGRCQQVLRPASSWARSCAGLLAATHARSPRLRRPAVAKTVGWPTGRRMVQSCSSQRADSHSSLWRPRLQPWLQARLQQASVGWYKLELEACNGPLRGSGPVRSVRANFLVGFASTGRMTPHCPQVGESAACTGKWSMLGRWLVPAPQDTEDGHWLAPVPEVAVPPVMTAWSTTSGL